MSERERLQAEIAALQAELDALPTEPDLSEAVEAYLDALPAGYIVHPDGLRAAVPAILKAYGHDKPAWPDENKLQKMANEVRKWAYSEGMPGPYTCPEDAALEMARRIREWQEANNG